jgi:hypothetical protein
MAARKPSARTERRARERALAKLADDRWKLAALSPGGHPSRPIALSSASQVEPHAASMPCPRCDGRARIEEHAAATVDGVRLRAVDLRCSMCGVARRVWFRLVTDAPS